MADVLGGAVGRSPSRILDGVYYRMVDSGPWSTCNCRLIVDVGFPSIAGFASAS